MRTKTTLLSAALLAAGALSSMAQSSVYSLNVVGYVTVTIPANPSTVNSGYTMVANPFDDGNGNSLTNVIKGDDGSQQFLGLPDSTSLLLWDNVNGQYGDTETFFQGAGWFDATTSAFPPTNSIPPGAGFWVQTPPSTPAFNITFVGNVQQGSQSISLGKGFTMVGSPFPVAIPIGAAGLSAGPNDPTAPTLQIYAADGDTAYLYNDSYVPGGYDIPGYIGNFSGNPAYGWFDSAAPDGAGSTNGPVINPGSAIFFLRAAEDATPAGVPTGSPTSAVTWTSSFTVQ